MEPISFAQGTRAPRARPFVLRLTHLFNPIVLRLAGTRLAPFYAVLEHTGRHSGKTFRTPVVLRTTPDGFIVPMPWGERTDWYRNVRAAGGCTIRWRGRRYAMTAPELLRSAAAGLEPRAQQMMLRFGITMCLRLHHAQEAAA